MKVESYACDLPRCTQVHSAVNNWLVVRLMDDHQEIWTWEKAEVAGLLDDLTAKHFCGLPHTLQFLSAEAGNKEEK